jgi:hypothetical protein
LERGGEGAGALASGLASGPGSGRAKALRRGRLLAGERVERVPVWPASSAIAALRERLPESLRTAVDRCPVPVLLPNDVEWLARARVFTGGPQGPGYTLAAAHAGLHLSVQASRVATLLPHVGHLPGKHRVRGAWGFLGENEGIHTASWIEHGVAYTAELECEAPDGPACQRERLVALVEGLEYVGGVGAVGGAL